MSADFCRNCDARLMHGAHFCSACGQSAAPIRTTTLEIFHDWSEHYIGSHGALWRTLGTLFRHPGRLTRDYIAGKRTMYLKPIQLYFLASILLFTITKFVDIGKIQFEGDQKPFSISTEAGNEMRTWLPSIAARIEARVNALNVMPRSELALRVNAFASKAIPIGLFSLVPIFAIFLKLLWGWRARYADHFVFALHIQATIFLFLAIFYIGPKDFGAYHGIVSVLLLATLWRAFGNHYGGGVMKRLVLLMPTALVYLIAFLIVMLAVFSLGVAIG